MTFDDNNDIFNVPYTPPPETSDTQSSPSETLSDHAESPSQRVQKAIEAYRQLQKDFEERHAAAQKAAVEEHEQKALSQTPPDLGDLTEMLEELNAFGQLSAPHDTSMDDMLQAQAQMLNNLFARTLYKADQSRSYHLEYMALALKIQKQSVETLRVRGGLNYMSSIMQQTPRLSGAGAPPPPKRRNKLS